MDVDEGWKRLVTVHDRALHSPSQPIIRVPQHLLATTTTHMTHVFTDSELLVGGSPGETSRYAQSLAERLVGLLCLQGENSRLPSGTYVNAANLNGRAVCGLPARAARKIFQRFACLRAASEKIYECVRSAHT